MMTYKVIFFDHEPATIINKFVFDGFLLVTENIVRVIYLQTILKIISHHPIFIYYLQQMQSIFFSTLPSKTKINKRKRFFIFNVPFMNNTNNLNIFDLGVAFRVVRWKRALIFIRIIVTI